MGNKKERKKDNCGCVVVLWDGYGFGLWVRNGKGLNDQRCGKVGWVE